jgi:hypothetical protein
MNFKITTFILTFCFFQLTNSGYAQLTAGDIQKNKIKSVTKKSWQNGLLYSESEYKYNAEGRIEENIYFNFNAKTNTTNFSKNRYHYKNNHIIRTFHYMNEVLTDSTVHHAKWDSQNWTFTDTVHLIATGKICVRQRSKTEDSAGIHIVNRSFTNDSIDSEENRNVYSLNDSTRIIVETMDYYYKGVKRTYYRDSMIEITTPNTFSYILWKDGIIKGSTFRKYVDSVCRYEIRKELDFKGKHLIKHETWYDEAEREIKYLKNGKKKTERHYEYTANHWKGTKIDEKVTFERKRRIIEKTRSEYDQRNLLQHVIFYDKNDEITGKIIWEYKYW